MSRFAATLAALVVSLAVAAWAEEPPVLIVPSTGTAAAPSAEQLKAWVGELTADEFLTRETAMLKLVAAGPAAVPAVKVVFAQNSLEAMSRGLHVLQQLGMSPDLETQEAARDALAQIAAAREYPVAARRADAALDWLIAQRSLQTLAELEALGAKIGRRQLFNGFETEEEIESVEIGPDFKGGEQELRRLKWLAVSRLILVGDKVTDAWLPHAVAMPDLRELHLYEAHISDAGLAVLAGHGSLQQVGIYYTPLSDAALAPLAKLPGLNFVKLYKTGISRAGVEKFKTDTGLAKVDYRRGAFLGVGCTPVDGACMLSTVHTSSPAEKAGLLREDILLRFGKDPAPDFETLTALISQHDVGDVIEIEVERRLEDDQGNIIRKNIVVKATLTPWEVDLAVRNQPKP